MNDLIVHQVDVTHFRLVELSRLADQAKPFYDWVEKTAKKVTGSHRELSEILMLTGRDDLTAIVNGCYQEVEEKRPLLFDGIGRVYPHNKACFFFFAWMIRDAPQQRLAPLISRMRQIEKIDKLVAETDTLVELILEYRSYVKSFSWLTVREVIIDRLEGSRRSIKGHHLESSVRTAIITAFQNYFSIYSNYGKYKKIDIAESQIKIGNHTIDVSVKLTPLDNSLPESLLIPIKTRETEGGGHSHIFTRDIIAAVRELKEDESKYYIVAVIVALNWSISELENINNQIDKVYHFNVNPNKFIGFDDASQIDLNRYIQGILNND
ncbi:hypothetical protein VB638_12235 [Dolichospermum sp. UHCC 0684]|uniref:hypothetical protein n=1 Tax=unclassified Dolichospermum TaxID=2622029 RepID=UPI001C2C07B1|nr:MULTISPECIES: hypothetical protein [unclassified Dolichospermum]MEA5530343.1 hypothetical protein [Dolichospermum sp. UHCC 0684]